MSPIGQRGIRVAIYHRCTVDPFIVELEYNETFQRQ